MNDALILQGPSILTVEVGRKPEKNPKRPSIHVKDLDGLLSQYNRELDQFGSRTVTVSQFTPEDAEMERQALLSQLQEAFELFLEHVKQEAKRYTLELYNGSHENPSKTLSTLLSKSSMTEWIRKFHECHAKTKLCESKDAEWSQKIRLDLESEVEVSQYVHLTKNAMECLDRHKVILTQDVQLLTDTQHQTAQLLKTVASSYITFNSWILEQWNRNTREIQNTYRTVQNRIASLFHQQPLLSEIHTLLNRYEMFLQAHEASLPLEFSLSVNPRKEWKAFMANSQPDECLRLMKNELHSLETVSNAALQTSIQVWKRELSKYDVDYIHQLSDNRSRIKRRLEDAVETETQQANSQRFKELHERIYRLGIGLQEKTNEKLAKYNAEFASQHARLMAEDQIVRKQLNVDMARLALADRPWGHWLDNRQHLIREWAVGQYSQAAIQGLFEIHAIVEDLRSRGDVIAQHGGNGRSEALKSRGDYSVKTRDGH
ncbi:unnamed protein product [Sphagnum jensenii]|uniref:Uncharacterized protein n=1 Tax=Sphagnum jensenii TaxID=128206 RepID=A0ABP0VDF4_9BRYO